jgi:hypothetical protein
MVSGPQRPTEQFAGAAIGQAQQDLLAGLTGGLDDTEHPEITVSDEQALGRATK